MFWFWFIFWLYIGSCLVAWTVLTYDVDSAPADKLIKFLVLCPGINTIVAIVGACIGAFMFSFIGPAILFGLFEFFRWIFYKNKE